MGPPPRSQRDSYRPQYDDRGPPDPPPDAAIAMFHFTGQPNGRDRHAQGRPRDTRGNDRNRFTFRAHTKISERPLLRDRSNQHEERVLGSHGQEDKFRDLDNLTDSDEAEMEDSEDEDERRSKRPKLDVQAPQTPKWSNPDPYTALPAPNETTGKKIDVVKMIRKAKNDANKSKGQNDAAEDFISFGMDDRAPSSLQGLPIPTGPRGDRSHLDLASRITSRPMGSSNPSAEHDDLSARTHQLVGGNDQTLGKRKRYDDENVASRAKNKSGRGRGDPDSNGILDVWRAIEGTTATPWLKVEKAETAAIALHREILDFYEWVRPQDYEFAIRADCINRLAETFRRHSPGELRAFGSYGAGLFLPTGDMDLVFLDSLFLSRMRRGTRNISLPLAKHQFRRWVDFIRNANIAKPGSILPIIGAKVPIIKFVDRLTGLKIDLSFNNDTGLVAIETFQKWKAAYPAMPILVSVIKQYLMLRGLNDVATGGLGGFSTICLVTSILQHLPNNRNPQNLGEVLLEFFNVYGNLLDRNSVAIRLDPPGYIDKLSYSRHLFNNDKKGRLTIIDPHRPDNNISGGSSEIRVIASSFSKSYLDLHDLLVKYDSFPGNVSFLETLIGGDFQAYNVQRNVLYSLHMGRPGLVAPSTVISIHQVSSSALPEASLQTQKPTGSRKETGLTNSEDEDDDGNESNLSHTSNTQNNAKSAKGNRKKTRAQQFKRLRPELAHKVGESLKMAMACKIGGYSNIKAMQRDFASREKALQKLSTT